MTDVSNKPLKYVYIISNPLLDGWLKIGMTNNIDRRLTTLQTSMPSRYAYQVELLVEMDWDHPVHCKLVEQGVERDLEWFKCDLATARTAVLEARNEERAMHRMTEMNRLKAANDGWLTGNAAPLSAGENQVK